jgi:hypothetical protein
MKDLKAFALALPLLVLPSWSLAQEPSHAMLPAKMPHYNVMKGRDHSSVPRNRAVRHSICQRRGRPEPEGTGTVRGMPTAASRRDNRGIAPIPACRHLEHERHETPDLQRQPV